MIHRQVKEHTQNDREDRMTEKKRRQRKTEKKRRQRRKRIPGESQSTLKWIIVYRGHNGLQYMYFLHKEDAHLI